MMQKADPGKHNLNLNKMDSTDDAGFNYCLEMCSFIVTTSKLLRTGTHDWNGEKSFTMFHISVDGHLLVACQ